MKKLLAIPLLLVCGAVQSQPTYHLTDLGTSGGPLSIARGINNLGQVTGQAFQTGNNQFAFEYSNGAMRNLGSLGPTGSTGFGINVLGEIAGAYGDIVSDWRAFLYSNGHMQDIGTLGGSSSQALAINKFGQTVGWSTLGESNDEVHAHPFLYSNGTMHDLGILSNFLGAEATAINNNGEVVGFGGVGDNAIDHAFVYSNRNLTDLGVALGGSNTSRAYGINDAGTIIGYFGPQSGPKHAFMYSNGSVHDLGVLGTGDFSEGLSINASGWVVGDSTTEGDGYDRGFLAYGGAMYDLNSLLDSSGVGYTVLVATSINDNGWIVGYGYSPLSGNGYDAFLLTPVGGPSHFGGALPR